MAISFIGAMSAETTAVTPPAHIAGDLLIAFAYRDGANTVPTLASGWTAINSAGANTNSFVAGYKFATSSSETCTGWTSASAVIVHVYRGAGGVGASAATTGSSGTITYPALTLQNTSGSSWVAGFVGHRSTNTTTINTPPTGMTNRRVLLGVNSDLASNDTNAGVTSWVSRTVVTGGTSSGFYTSVIEIQNGVVATLSSPNVSVASGTSGTPSVSTTVGNGTIYCVAVPDGDTPSVAQIIAGQNSSGGAAIASSTLPVTASGIQTLPAITGLTTGTNYDVWFVHSNAIGNSNAVKADFKPINATFASTAWLNPGTALHDSAGGASFLNPTNVMADDGSYSTVTLNSGNAGFIMAHNFQASIPTDATILGVELRIKGMTSGVDAGVSSNAALSLDATSFSNAQSAAASNNAFAPPWTTTNTAHLGGASTGWAATYWGSFSTSSAPGVFFSPSVAQLNSSSFGVVVTIFSVSGSTRTISIDSIQIKVHYQIEDAPVTPSAFDALFWAFP